MIPAAVSPDVLRPLLQSQTTRRLRCLQRVLLPLQSLGNGYVPEVGASLRGKATKETLRSISLDASTRHASTGQCLLQRRDRWLLDTLQVLSQRPLRQVENLWVYTARTNQIGESLRPLCTNPAWTCLWTL